MSNVIIENAVEEMMKGVELATSVIRETYGGSGKNVVVESNLYPFHIIANDAQSMIQAIKVKEHGQKIGLDFIKELCDKADKVSGDARKTTILIASEILKLGYQSKLNKLELKRQLDDLIPFIEKEIDLVTKPIDINDVFGVARTASESEEIAKLFQAIYPQIGKEGILNIEGSKTYETSYKITNGVRFEGTGMLSPEMVHDEEAKKNKQKETKAIYFKPNILVTKKRISSDDDINPILVEIRDNDSFAVKDVIIFTQDMDSGVASRLIALHKSGHRNILIIKAPVLWQNYVFEDFAKCVEATIVEDSTGLTFKNLKPEHLGTCDRIEVDNEDTILTGIADITEHLKTLAERGTDDDKLRLSWLANKSAILKLGANSETDLSYKRLKANDANRSTYLALHYGVVEGGGKCLYRIARKLIDKRDEASKILAKALESPLNQARENYGVEHQVYMDLVTEDIVDASMVIKRAVRNAIGIASTILTASSLIHIPQLTNEEMAYNIAMKQSNPFSQ